MVAHVVIGAIRVKSAVTPVRIEGALEGEEVSRELLAERLEVPHFEARGLQVMRGARRALRTTSTSDT